MPLSFNHKISIEDYLLIPLLNPLLNPPLNPGVFEPGDTPPGVPEGLDMDEFEITVVIVELIVKEVRRVLPAYKEYVLPLSNSGHDIINDAQARGAV